jgi:hypothetical protein
MDVVDAGDCLPNGPEIRFSRGATLAFLAKHCFSPAALERLVDLEPSIEPLNAIEIVKRKRWAKRKNGWLV